MAYSSSGKALKFSGKTLSIYSNLCRDIYIWYIVAIKVLYCTLMATIYYLPHNYLPHKVPAC